MLCFEIDNNKSKKCSKIRQKVVAHLKWLKTKMRLMPQQESIQKAISCSTDMVRNKQKHILSMDIGILVDFNCNLNIVISDRLK